MANQTNDPRMGNSVNFFKLEGLVQYGFRRETTVTKMQPYITFLVQQKYKSQNGKEYTRGFQVATYVKDLVDELTVLTNQTYVRCEGNVIVDYFVTKDNQKVTKVKLLANKVEILEELPTKFIDKSKPKVADEDAELDKKLKELK